MNGSASNTSGVSEAKLRLKPRTDLSRIPQEVRDELERDGYVIIEAGSGGGNDSVVLQPNEPEDKTKIWFQTDVNGVPIGVPLTYSSSQSRWIPIGLEGSAYQQPTTRNGSDYVPAGASTKLFGPFATVGTTRYLVTLTPTFFWNSAYHVPVAFISTFGFAIVNKAEDSFSVAFTGVQTGGLAFDWQLTVLAQDPVSTATV